MLKGAAGTLTGRRSEKSFAIADTTRPKRRISTTESFRLANELRVNDVVAVGALGVDGKVLHGLIGLTPS